MSCVRRGFLFVEDPMFDFIAFFKAYNVEYRESGPNVGKDHVVIHCPFCGAADEGQHLSVSLLGRGWRCFRQPVEHRGIAPHRLIRALSGLPSQTVALMVGSEAPPLQLDYAEQVAALMDDRQASTVEAPPGELDA